MSLNIIRQDFRFASRILVVNPWLSAVVVISLAIGIGANTAVFSVADAILLRPLPYPQPERLAALWVRAPGAGIPEDWISPGEYLDIRNRNHVFSDMTIARGRDFNLTGRAEPERVEGMSASSSLFRMLGAKPLLGRLFGDAEDAPGGPLLLVLTYNAWKDRFGADRNIAGKAVTLNGRAVTVIGVLTQDFSLSADVMRVPGGTEGPEMFIPLAFGADAANNRQDESYNVMARLRPGVSLLQAQNEVAAIAAGIRQQDHRDPTFTIAVVGLNEQVVGPTRGALLAVIAAVCLVLLAACVNVANLLLSRAISRAREAAVRSALGASRADLIRPVLLESLLLGAAGALAGLLLASLLIRTVRGAAGAFLPRADEIGMNGAVFVFAGFVSLLTGLFFGIAPALQVARTDLNRYLKAGGRSVRTTAGAVRFRGVLVVTEIALSLTLLAGAGLLIRSFDRLRHVPPGFNPDHVLSFRVALRWPRYQGPANVNSFVDMAGDRIARAPGVLTAGLTSSLPMAASSGWGPIEVEGYTPSPGEPEASADVRSVTADYFRALQIPLLAGRVFSPVEGTSENPAVMVDEKVVRRFWPDGSALGKRIRLSGDREFSTVVGVCGSVKQEGLGQDGRMAVYFPVRQMTVPTLYLVARTRSDPAGMSRALTREIHAIDPEVPVFSVSSMDDLVARSLARPRFAVMVFGAFAVFALILAAIGVYGVVSYSVAQSAGEIGIRMALGAHPKAILGMVLMKALRLALAGTAAGLCGAWFLTRTMQSLLFGVSATDPLTFLAVPAFLVLVALAAGLIPALRAARLNPMTALREE